ncbi:hypothetical protein P7K49_023168 [Saguinus oedipus]|uniref:Uncharacterized protein n=1 Tax=Saguinus oedipus TaxID=9490 RepID=A0ABQ9UN66_SAGOE|nr:hypothetical protein P7K49_023168 [Saguinus oedipus]
MADLDPKPRGSSPSHCFAISRCPQREKVLTVTFHPLVDESIQQRPTMVTKRGAGVRVDLKLVFAPGVLEPKETTEGAGVSGTCKALPYVEGTGDITKNRTWSPDVIVPVGTIAGALCPDVELDK